MNKISRLLYKDENILENVLINYETITKEKQVFLLNELMYNIYMIDPHNSYIFRFYSDLGNLREIQIEALEKCYDFLNKEGYNAENIGFSLSEIRDTHLFDTLERIIKEKSGNMLPRKHSDYEVRIEWYKPIDERIEQIIEKYFRIPLKDNSYQKARLAFHLRNLFKMKARVFMKDQSGTEGLMISYPIRTWNQVYQKSADKVQIRLNKMILETGKTEIEILNELGFNSIEEMINREIINGAQRTNKDVTDYLLGIKKLT
ncbi:MAG: hypothetical protein ACFFD7_00850 [Candidatus Thorarchaeota archaeon]